MRHYFHNRTNESPQKDVFPDPKRIRRRKIAICCGILAVLPIVFPMILEIARSTWNHMAWKVFYPEDKMHWPMRRQYDLRNHVLPVVYGGPIPARSQPKFEYDLSSLPNVEDPNVPKCRILPIHQGMVLKNASFLFNGIRYEGGEEIPLFKNKIYDATLIQPESENGLFEGVVHSFSANWEGVSNLCISVSPAKMAGDVPGETKTIILPGGGEMVLVWIPSGRFQTTTNDVGFWMGSQEVSQKQWSSVMTENPSSWESEEYPVDRVTWEDCFSFLKAIADSYPSFRFSLPTIQQQEFASLAGASTRYYWGDVPHIRNSNYYDLEFHGRERPAPCGSYPPNAWGLYDMHGNVREWCMDRCEQNPEYAPPNSRYYWAVGGSWLDSDIKISRRSYICLYPSNARISGNGFRVIAVPKIRLP